MSKETATAWRSWVGGGEEQVSGGGGADLESALKGRWETKCMRTSCYIGRELHCRHCRDPYLICGVACQYPPYGAPSRGGSGDKKPWGRQLDTTSPKNAHL